MKAVKVCGISHVSSCRSKFFQVLMVRWCQLSGRRFGIQRSSLIGRSFSRSFGSWFRRPSADAPWRPVDAEPASVPDPTGSPREVPSSRLWKLLQHALGQRTRDYVRRREHGRNELAVDDVTNGRDDGSGDVAVDGVGDFRTFGRKFGRRCWRCAPTSRMGLGSWSGSFFLQTFRLNRFIVRASLTLRTFSNNTI